MNRRQWTTAAATVAATLGVSLGITAPAYALNGTVTPAALAGACQSRPGNHVMLTGSLKVEGVLGVVTSVSTKCTISIPAGAALELVRARLTFAGPVQINGVSRTKVELVEQSRLNAPALDFSLAATETELKVDRSELRSGPAGTRIAMGDISKVQFAYPSNAGGSVVSTGPVSLSGGNKLYLELNEATVSGAGVSVTLNGPEGLIKAERATVSAGNQPLAITGSGPKALLEAKGSRFLSQAAVTVALPGAESTVKAVSTEFGASAALTVSASASQQGGLVELSGPNMVVRGRSATVEASPGAANGKVIFKLGTGQATGPAGELIYRTGMLGATEVAESTLSANGAVRITTGVGGVCKQEKNSITAPVTQLCT